MIDTRPREEIIEELTQAEEIIEASKERLSGKDRIFTDYAVAVGIMARCLIEVLCDIRDSLITKGGMPIAPPLADDGK